MNWSIKEITIETKENCNSAERVTIETKKMYKNGYVSTCRVAKTMKNGWCNVNRVATLLLLISQFIGLISFCNGYVIGAALYIIALNLRGLIRFIIPKNTQVELQLTDKDENKIEEKLFSKLAKFFSTNKKPEKHVANIEH